MSIGLLSIIMLSKNPEYIKNFNQRKASTDHWMDLSIGSSACHLGISQIQKRNALDAELYISEDKELFRSLFQKKDEIESSCGFSLEWRELPEKKASRIIIEKPVDLDLANRDKWTEQFEWIMGVTLKLKKAFKKYL